VRAIGQQKGIIMTISEIPLTGPRPPAATRDLVAAARACLAAAAVADSAGQKFALSHLSALRSAAAVLACQGRPSRSRRLRSAWDLLADVAPEFAEWAAFFAAGATKRARAEAGLNVVTSREADDLYRDARVFHDLVCIWLDRREHPQHAPDVLCRAG